VSIFGVIEIVFGIVWQRIYRRRT